MEKCRDWVQCHIYDEYICPKCYDKRDISADDDFFFVAFALDHKHKGQISIQLSTAVLNPSRPLHF